MENEQRSREIFGERVRAARKRRGWTPDEFAARLGKSKATVSRIETGKQNVGVWDIQAIARVLQMPVSALIEEEQEGNSASAYTAREAELRRRLERLQTEVEECQAVLA